MAHDDQDDRDDRDDREDGQEPPHFEEPAHRRRWLGGHRRSGRQPVEDSPLWAEQYEDPLDDDPLDDPWDGPDELSLADAAKSIILGTIYICALLLAVPLVILIAGLALEAGLGFLKVLWPYG